MCLMVNHRISAMLYDSIQRAETWVLLLFSLSFVCYGETSQASLCILLYYFEQVSINFIVIFIFMRTMTHSFNYRFP